MLSKKVPKSKPTERSEERCFPGLIFFFSLFQASVSHSAKCGMRGALSPSFLLWKTTFPQFFQQSPSERLWKSHWKLLSTSFSHRLFVNNILFALYAFSEFTTALPQAIGILLKIPVESLSLPQQKIHPRSRRRSFLFFYREHGKFFSEDPKMKQSGGRELYVRTQPALFYCNLKSFLN